MRMNAFALAASLAAALPVAAAAADEHRFVQDGQTYIYTSTAAPEGTVIQGRRLPEGAEFRLVVRGRWVSGYAGNTPVSFPVSEARGAYSKPALIAAR